LSRTSLIKTLLDDFLNTFDNFISTKSRSIPLLDRWLLSELLPPFVFAVVALSVVSLSLGVMFDLVRQIVEAGLPFYTALKVLLLRLPGFLVISLPMAMLMSTLLAFSRLSSNSEIKALRSIGVSSKRIIVTALLLGIFMTGLTFIFNNFVVPRTNRAAESMLTKGLQVAMHSDYGKDIMYSRYGKIINLSDNTSREGITHLFHAKELSNSQMVDVTLLDFSRLGYTQMLIAKKAFWRTIEAKWEFEDGKILNISPNNLSTSVEFDRYIYPLDTNPVEMNELPKDPNNLTISEAIKAQALYKNIGNLKEERRMKVRIQEKFTLPISCIVFGLIGSSFAIKTDINKGQVNGFGLSIIVIIFYYILSFSFSSLGVIGSLNPIVAAWSPIAISFAGGIFLLRTSD
tara:strand:+ start:6943 stop:8148 length:1206 start_codon:yes stop_codon:yes gene_type:complete